MPNTIDPYFTENLFNHLQDGIIVMTSTRTIIRMNDAAKRLMGWKEGDIVPYCTYCETRTLQDGEERCFLLANDGKIPYFSSKMPKVGQYMVNVEMSNVLMYEEADEKYYLLVIRDRTLKEKEDAAKLSKKILHRLTEAREVEHKRLSQELHDGVGQALYSVAIAMDNLSMSIEDEELATYLKEVRQELGKAMEDVKFYSQSLRPKSLDALGLMPTIETLLQSIRQKMPSLNIRLETNCYDRLTPIAEINIYRVVQEATHNMMKYAKATEALVQFEKDSFGLQITIEDNGVGFHVEREKDGLGLLHIGERISQLRGKTIIQSEIGIGTKITMYVPKHQLVGDDDEYIDRG